MRGRKAAWESLVEFSGYKKPVSYAQSEDSDSDGDFVSAIGPLKKKSRTDPKELKQEKPKPKLKNLAKEDVSQEKTPQKRMALDDKLYQRDLKVALALSAKETPTDTTDVPGSRDENIGKCDKNETETVTKTLHISNCSVASDYQDLDKITEEENSHDVQGKRKAASKAVVRQRKMLLEDSDGDSVRSSEPDFETMTSAPAVKSESWPSSKTGSPPSNALRKPLQICSPSVESKRPKWVPPAPAGSSSSSSSSSSSRRSPLPGTSVKPPSHSLRLGLSRLARVKPLHPTATTS
ncbi:PREDICTED: RAD51-associated protein 1 [Elephantulus edwardii]|uniref:RAD51-associated protein 1 n=1 Tax=Elephantulus edwardii TaxID=28737 RepID=UPI0003F0A3AC|nr:PREDICTED: RAD51-associated protein 1 [Elephantulus edwardii]